MNRRPPQRTVRRDSDNRSEAGREIEEELDAHLAFVAEELIAGGWPAGDARAEAERRFGDLNQTREYCARQSTMARTQERWTMWWDTLRQDLRYSVRTLTKAPTYALVVIVTLAAAIAANTTVFSLMNPYLFRPLPFAAPDGLVQLGGIDPVEGWDGGRFSVPQMEELSTRVRAIESVAGYYYGGVNLTGTDQAESLTASWFWGDMLSVLGVQPLIGRAMTASDLASGASEVALMSERLWERRYSRDPAVVGTTIELDGRPRTVIGVMSRDFAFPFGGLSFWLPAPDGGRMTDRAAMNFLPVIRLSPGATPEGLRTEAGAALAESARAFPETDGRYEGVSAKGLRQGLNFAWEVLPIAFALLLGAVSFVLVIACVNVASLTLARAGGRNREVAVRAAVGADRSRLVRQLVTEGFVLASIGGGLGILIAWMATGLINDLLPPDLFRVGDVSLDGRVLGFTALVTLSTPFLFGLLPAWNVARLPLSELHDGGAFGLGIRSDGPIGAFLTGQGSTQRAATPGASYASPNWLVPGPGGSGTRSTVWFLNAGSTLATVTYRAAQSNGSLGPAEKLAVPIGTVVSLAVDSGLVVRSSSPITVGWTATAPGSAAFTMGLPFSDG